jgi:hypothetical protein
MFIQSNQKFSKMFVLWRNTLVVCIFMFGISEIKSKCTKTANNKYVINDFVRLEGKTRSTRILRKVSEFVIVV